MNDLRVIRARKQQELVYYNGELKALRIRIDILRSEVHLTERIIEMIQTEKVTNIPL